VDLNTQLDSSSAGWTLQEARAINDAGQIVGTGLYHGTAHAFLLQPSAGSGLAAPKINGVSPSGVDVLVSFSTVDKASYTLLRRSNAGSGAWTPVATGISGNGGTVTVKDAGALTAPQRFYRAVLNP
jgi:probable HAF family extracellular repeat protein